LLVGVCGFLLMVDDINRGLGLLQRPQRPLLVLLSLGRLLLQGPPPMAAIDVLIPPARLGPACNLGHLF
jgi:hypothetical protein